MNTDSIEKKVAHLDTFSIPKFDQQALVAIKEKTQRTKGSKVKLQLSPEGLRYMKSSMIQGKMLLDYIPMNMLKFFSIERNNPEVLFVVSVSLQDNSSNKFKVNVFRCNDAMEASLFATVFQRISSNRQAVTVVRTKAPPTVKEDEINWTLRNKEVDNSKRELRQMVDIGNGEKHEQVVTTSLVNGDGDDQHVVANGHSEVYEHGVRIPLYRKGKPTRSERDSFDTESEVSESALRLELESLSHELRDIKLMLEKNTGLTTSSELSTPRDSDERPVNVQIHKHTVAPEVVVYRKEQPRDRVERVVIQDDRPKENGYTVSSSGSTTHVRVSVPDYRAVTERSTSGVGEERDYEVIRATRPSTTSYEHWKRNTVERGAVRHVNDVAERIQWRSKPNRKTHVISSTTRPRSALPSWSSDAVDSAQMVEVRHHSAGVGPVYGRVSFNPRVAKMQERKSQSLRGAHGLSSSTVVRPIDKVYVGRGDAKHHSLSSRGRVALRPSIVVKDIDIEDEVQPLHVEHNNNVVKSDDDHLLDVSGLDLYQETPSNGAVIRT